MSEMTLKTLAPELNPNELKAVYRLVYEDMVGSLPEDKLSPKFANDDWLAKNPKIAAMIEEHRVFNTALDQTRTALDTKLQEVLEEL